MAKKVIAGIKLQIQAGKATPSPPIGPALGQHGVNIMEFCKAYNAMTQNQGGDDHTGRDHGLRGPVLHLRDEDTAGLRSAQAGGEDRQGSKRPEKGEGGHRDLETGQRDCRVEIERFKRRGSGGRHKNNRGNGEIHGD